MCACHHAAPLSDGFVKVLLTVVDQLALICAAVEPVSLEAGRGDRKLKKTYSSGHLHFVGNILIPIP